jgi:hypothetical protein
MRKIMYFEKRGCGRDKVHAEVGRTEQSRISRGDAEARRRKALFNRRERREPKEDGGEENALFNCEICQTRERGVIDRIDGMNQMGRQNYGAVGEFLMGGDRRLVCRRGRHPAARRKRAPRKVGPLIRRPRANNGFSAGRDAGLHGRQDARRYTSQRGFGLEVLAGCAGRMDGEGQFCG